MLTIIDIFLHRHQIRGTTGAFPVSSVGSMIVSLLRATFPSGSRVSCSLASPSSAAAFLRFLPHFFTACPSSACVVACGRPRFALPTAFSVALSLLLHRRSSAALPVVSSMVGHVFFLFPRGSPDCRYIYRGNLCRYLAGRFHFYRGVTNIATRASMTYNPLVPKNSIHVTDVEVSRSARHTLISSG